MKHIAIKVVGLLFVFIISFWIYEALISAKNNPPNVPNTTNNAQSNYDDFLAATKILENNPSTNTSNLIVQINGQAKLKHEELNILKFTQMQYFINSLNLPSQAGPIAAVQTRLKSLLDLELENSAAIYNKQTQCNQEVCAIAISSKSLSVLKSRMKTLIMSRDIMNEFGQTFSRTYSSDGNYHGVIVGLLK